MSTERLASRKGPHDLTLRRHFLFLPWLSTRGLKTPTAAWQRASEKIPSGCSCASHYLHVSHSLSRVQLLTLQREDVLSLCMARLVGKTSTPPADACGSPQDFQAHAVGSDTRPPRDPRGAEGCMQMCPRPSDPVATMTSPGAGQQWEVSECGRAYRAQFLRRIGQEAGAPVRGNGVRIWGADGNPGRPPAMWTPVGLGRNNDF